MCGVGVIPLRPLQLMNTSASQSSISFVQIPCGRASIRAELAIPEEARGLVVFAHATHGGWTNSRNWPIAWKLHQSGYATLLLDLLTPVEASLETAKGFLHFEVPLLTERLTAAIQWAGTQDLLADLPIACFGSDAGAAAVLNAAASIPAIVTVVGRAARTDLIAEPARHPDLPVLLMTGENDRRTLRSNREFAAHAPAARRVEVIKGATHRFTEEGCADEVANATKAWLDGRLHGRRLKSEDLWAYC
jgi:putative phosphoribosyl transferase